jgi:hypothetical protein
MGVLGNDLAVVLTAQDLADRLSKEALAEEWFPAADPLVVEPGNYSSRHLFEKFIHVLAGSLTISQADPTTGNGRGIGPGAPD